MIPLKAHQIRGNWATLLLPIQEDDSIDYQALAEEIDTLISLGVDGIYSNGTAGEFYNITEEEFDRVSDILADRCNKAGIPFQIGVSHPSPQLSLDRLKRAVALAPSAVQVILPDWYPTTVQENIRFLNRMAEVANPIGLVLYNPGHAKRVLTPEEIGRLSQTVSGLVGVKVRDSNPGMGQAEWYEAIRRHCADLSVFVPGHHLATGIQLGAQGAYSNIASLNPKAAQRWYDSMHETPEAALALERRIITFMEEHIRPYVAKQGYSPQALDKLLAALGGWAPIGTRLRWPYRCVPTEDVVPLRKAARTLLPEFFKNAFIYSC